MPAKFVWFSRGGLGAVFVSCGGDRDVIGKP
ncbi:hypothetical protein V1288_003291 [Bradyrhizobium sp. AZCC 2176]